MQVNNVKTFTVTRRQSQGGTVLFIDAETIVADNPRHAVMMYCTKYGMAGVKQYGNYIWKAFAHGVAYLIKCDSAASGAERNRL